MTLLQAIIMGLIQGITEFLPVSSSGHLALFKALFHVNTDTGILFDVLLHLGTLIAIFVVYYKDIWEMICEGIAIIIDFFVNIGIWFHNLFSAKKSAYRKIVNSAYRRFVMLVIVSTIPISEARSCSTMIGRSSFRMSLLLNKCVSFISINPSFKTPCFVQTLAQKSRNHKRQNDIWQIFPEDAIIKRSNK